MACKVFFKYQKKVGVFLAWGGSPPPPHLIGDISPKKSSFLDALPYPRNVDSPGIDWHLQSNWNTLIFLLSVKISRSDFWPPFHPLPPSKCSMYKDLDFQLKIRDNKFTYIWLGRVGDCFRLLPDPAKRPGSSDQQVLNWKENNYGYLAHSTR